MSSVAPEIRYLYYYYLSKYNTTRNVMMSDKEVFNLIVELVNEGHWTDTSIKAVIDRLKNKEDKSNEVG